MTKSKLFVVLVAFAFAATGGRVLHAQVPAQGTVTDSGLAAALQALHSGDHVRISVSGVRRTGPVAFASPNQLAFQRSAGLAPVPVSSIDSVWKWKSSAGGGALAGAIVVGGAGAFFGYAFAGMAQSSAPSSGESLGAAAAFGVVGGLMGALVGGTIGSVLSHWTLLHPSRP